MAERFENIDNILCDRGKKYRKSLVEAINRYEKQDEEERRTVSF